MLFLFLTAAFAKTWNRVETQPDYSVCVEISAGDECDALLSGALGGAGFEEGSCTLQTTVACPDWISQSDQWTSGLTMLGNICASFSSSVHCSGNVPESQPGPGGVDLSGCTDTDLSCMTCDPYPNQCADFEDGGCAACLTECLKGVYEQFSSLDCSSVPEMPNVSACGVSALDCAPESCSMTECSSYEQYGCASCVTSCVTDIVGQSFDCSFADPITEWTGFEFPTDCDPSCIQSSCTIPTDCSDYEAKVSTGGCADCLDDCGRQTVAGVIPSCDAILRTWTDVDVSTCSSNTATCMASSCAMPKTCDDYATKVSTGGCAACLDDCARGLVAQTISGCDAIMNQAGNDNGSAGALSLALALIGSFLYHF